MGSTIMVNGTIGAYPEVTTERARLRVLNASTARTYNFGFDDDRSFGLVGTDGGLLPAPDETTRLRLSPGERAEPVVTLDPGETTTLISDSPELGRFAPAAFGATDTCEVLQLRDPDAEAGRTRPRTSSLTSHDQRSPTPRSLASSRSPSG
jgi:FtsP/CotA-like multicopper oxidase with cupredoxin domain